MIPRAEARGDSFNLAGSINDGSPPKIDFNAGGSKIYDDAQLHIATDDMLYLDAYASGINQGIYLKARTGYNRIYDDGQMHIATDDQLYLDASTSNNSVNQGLYLKARTGYNHIYDDANLHIVTDDDLYLDAPGATFVSGDLVLSGLGGSLVVSTGWIFAGTVIEANDVTASSINSDGTSTMAKTPNYVSADGNNNAILVTVSPIPSIDGGSISIPLAAGLKLTINLNGKTLQAGANTLAYNGGAAKAVKKHTNPANDLSAAYAGGSIIELIFDGTVWQDLSQ